MTAFENTQSHLLLLADFEEEEYNLKHSPAHLHKGVTYAMHGILTFIKRLTAFVSSRFTTASSPGQNRALPLSCWGADRPCQKQVRTRGRKRAPTKASYHPPSTGETTWLYQNGPNASGASGHDGSDLEASAFHRSGRRRCFVGIVRGSSSLGNTSPERLLPNQRSPQRPWPAFSLQETQVDPKPRYAQNRT